MDLLHQRLVTKSAPAARRLPGLRVAGRTEFRTGRAEHVVAGPTEIAERHVVMRPAAHQRGFKVTVLVHARNQRVAEQHDPIASEGGGDFRFVVEVPIQFQPGNDVVLLPGRRSGSQLCDLFGGQAAIVDSQVVDPAMKQFAAIFVGTDKRRCTAARIERTGRPLLADLLAVNIEPQPLAVECARHVMPTSIDQFFFGKRRAEFAILPADPQADPEPPDVVGLSD